MILILSLVKAFFEYFQLPHFLLSLHILDHYSQLKYKTNYFLYNLILLYLFYFFHLFRLSISSISPIFPLTPISLSILLDCLVNFNNWLSNVFVNHFISLEFHTSKENDTSAIVFHFNPCQHQIREF